MIFLFFSFPKKTYTPGKEIHKINHNENIFAGMESIPDEHKNFILKLIPLIQQANQEVLTERERLLNIYSLVSEGKKIKLPEKRWLKKLEIKYRGKKNKSLFTNDDEIVLEYMDDLLSRVDIVPIRLALAQAAIESGWGGSRFCIEGNSYFGIHCYKPQCGIRARANENGGFEVKSYLDAQESVKDYVLFLNSKRGMQRFRDERKRFLHEAGNQDLYALTASMKGYSAIGESYQDILESILRNYIPENLADN